MKNTSSSTARETALEFAASVLTMPFSQRRAFYLSVSVGMAAVCLDSAHATPAHVPPGPYQAFCRGDSMMGGDLVASCLDFFGGFKETRLKDANQCVGNFKDFWGAKHPMNIEDVDGELTCVLSKQHVGGGHATDYDIVSLVPGGTATYGAVHVQTWKIDRPNVWNVGAPDGRDEYPMIVYQPGDGIRINATGCVQTGGFGAHTWKRYLSPSGPNAQEFYSGTANIFGVTQGGFERIGGIVEQQIANQTNKSLPAHLRGAVVVPGHPDGNTFHKLWLGYQDDNLSDNGYWNHDDGTDDQCKNIGPAQVWVEIISGVTQNAPLISPHTKPFDLVWDMNNQEDDNGLPVDAQWNFKLETGRQPDFKSLCGAGIGSVPGLFQYPIDRSKLNSICSSMPFDFNTHPLGGICLGDPIPGHMNFGIATYTGNVTWEGWSGSSPNDNEWNLRLAPDDGAGLTSLGDSPAPGKTIGLEFDFTDVLFWPTPFWHDLVSSAGHAVNPWFGYPASSTRSVIDGPDGNGLRAVVIGEIGVDGVHGGYVESHPVFAMGLKVNEQSGAHQVTETWAFFLKNFGNEGGCSDKIEFWDNPDGDYFIPLEWPIGANAVKIDGAPNVVGWNGPTPVTIEQNPGQRQTLIHVHQPKDIPVFGAGGTVTITYSIPSQPLKKPPKVAAARIGREVEPEPEFVDLGARIADPAARSRYAAELNEVLSIQPELKLKAPVAMTVPLTIAVHEHVRGAAGHGLITRARVVPDAQKLDVSRKLFAVMQKYKRDLKLDIPDRMPEELFVKPSK